MLEIGILGVLKERPMHGYELKKKLSFLLGHFWQVSYGSLYPALKRLEKRGAIERFYSSKEKSKRRNVYRITDDGERVFKDLLSATGTVSEVEDSEKFSVRMAFFQYMEPETRLWLLERRKHFLQERLTEMKGYGKTARDRDEAEADTYRLGMFRHRIELTEYDIAWLDGLIDQERTNIEAAKKSPPPKPARKEGNNKRKLSVSEPASEVSPSKV